MKKIKRFNIQKLYTSEDFGFQKRVEAGTALLTQEIDKPVIAEYVAAINAFDEVLSIEPFNTRNAFVTTADKEVRTCWRRLRAQVKAMLYYPIADRRTVSAEALMMIRTYGDITNFSYNEKYGCLHNLLQDLDSMGEEKQKLICIDAWVAELHSKYDAFMSTFAARTDEESQRRTGIVVKTRNAADRAYRNLITKINALALVNGDDHYAAFIGHLNVLIDDEKGKLTARDTRAKNNRAETEVETRIPESPPVSQE